MLHRLRLEMRLALLHRSSKAAATRTTTPLDELAVLANSPWGDVRVAVATNPTTTPEILADLALNGGTSSVRVAVAHNPRTTPEDLDLLAHDWVSWVREAADEARLLRR